METVDEVIEIAFGFCIDDAVIVNVFDEEVSVFASESIDFGNEAICVEIGEADGDVSFRETELAAIVFGGSVSVDVGFESGKATGVESGSAMEIGGGEGQIGIADDTNAKESAQIKGNGVAPAVGEVFGEETVEAIGDVDALFVEEAFLWFGFFFVIDFWFLRFLVFLLGEEGFINAQGVSEDPVKEIAVIVFAIDSDRILDVFDSSIGGIAGEEEFAVWIDSVSVVIDFGIAFAL